MNALTAKKNTAMKTQLALLSSVALLLAGCAEPVPPCLVLRSSGASYASEWLNGTITAGAGSPNCAVFGTGPYTGNGSNPGTQVDLATTSSIYPYGSTGGFPFRVQLFGVDKFAPIPGTCSQNSAIQCVVDSECNVGGGTGNTCNTNSGGSSQISIAPEIFFGAFPAPAPANIFNSGFVIGNLESENPTAQSLCFVPAFQAPVEATFGWGGATGDLDVSLTFSTMTLYETTAIPGTQFTVDVTATVSDVGGGNACTATYNVLAFAQATTCMTLVNCDPSSNACDISNGGQAPYADDQVQDNLCTDFNPPSGDQMWINYAANGLPAGAATNRNFPIACDQITGYCVLPPGTGTITLPVVGSTPRQ